MNDLFQWSEARKRADSGMRTALDHAESKASRWGELAYRFLVYYAASRGGYFISEDVSDATLADKSFPQPPDKRSWGKVYRRAAKAGVIVQDGFGMSRIRCSPCPRWKPTGRVG